MESHIPLFIHHGKEHINQMREKCAELHKSGNGNKKVATLLKMPISIVRAILKKFKATGTVTNTPERGPMFIYPSHTERRMIKRPNKSPRITVGEL